MAHQAILLIGSNIDPTVNIPKAIHLLREAHPIARISSVWETNAVGRNDAPRFLNLAVEINTVMDMATLKESSLKQIETRLGRIRTEDKNAPRTMDIDIIFFDQQVVDPTLWAQVHIILPVAEICPEFQHPITGIKLTELARRLFPGSQARIVEDLVLD